MEQVHGVDVSWMTQGSPKDRLNKSASPPKSTPASQPRQIPPASPSPSQQKADARAPIQQNGQPDPSAANGAAGSNNARRLSRSGSVDKQPGPNGTPPGRRNSWFSSISSKFSSGSSNAPQSPTATQPQQQAQQPGQHHHLLHHNNAAEPQPPSPTPEEPPVPKTSMSRNLVLQHGTKPDASNAPYTPAPPRSGQAGILGVFRRLSSSSGGGLGPAGKLGHGLVERRVLNVDQNRERCPISELNGAKLRRVSFCVDVEIAPLPKYSDADVQPKPIDKTQKKKLTEKGEGEALKHPKAAEVAKETEAEAKPAEQAAAAVPATQSNGAAISTSEAAPESALSTSPPDTEKKDDDKDKESTSRKKEKKKRSEEERKARKEKRRRLAEDNGSIPMEIRYDDSGDSSPADTPVSGGTPRSTTSSPTTSPVRIYRRCCQLRETPILKKITEQLTDPSNTSANGVVNKLDLTGYWLQLADLITLGDWLAVVPVRDLLLENIGLTDEGLRVILAGVLAAKIPDTKRRRPKHELEDQGGVVERLVLKNNKLGPDGWKHLSLFIYMCRSLKSLDISHVPFPRQAQAQANGAALPNGAQIPRSIDNIFSTALAERLAGSTLEILNIGEIEATMEQFGVIIDGAIKCKIKRVGFAHNHLDEHGVEHVARYLASGVCEGLDLGGNDLGPHMDKITEAIAQGESPLWALSLAGCSLTPSALCKVLPALVKLENFRFIDLSHNHELFNSTPSAVGLLRRYLPKMKALKRMHLQDVNMTSDQAIALVEIVPEVHQLAHINLLENAELVKLAHAKTEEAQEEACALFASLMAAARVSKSIICVDIEVPNDEAGEIVKAMAKQVVAYCLRNMEQLPDTNIGAAVAAALSETQADQTDCKPSAYPDVLVHLVGHDVMEASDGDEDNDSAPDEDYVIGGTGVVKALKCCLENRGGDVDSRRQSGEFTLDVEGEEGIPRPKLATGGKAKDMSKHLLAGARKIRTRIQPALTKARANPSDEMNLRKLTFLDDTLRGIIKRFEDEFPDTREDDLSPPPLSSHASPVEEEEEHPPPLSLPHEDSAIATLSDAEEDPAEYGPKTLSRSNSMLSRTLAEEEGRILRAGHRFRAGVARQEYMDMVNTIEDIESDPNHVRLLTDWAEEVGGEFLVKVKEKGVVRAYKEDKELLAKSMRAMDEESWDSFVEAQNKAVQNVSLEGESAIVD